MEEFAQRKNSTQVAGQIAQSLVDEKLMAKYGTSLEMGMTREYQKYVEEKYQKLKKEFEKINADANDFVSLEELVEFFQKYSRETGQSYDRTYIERVFRVLDKNYDQKLTIQEFVFSYIQLEEKLRMKKIKLAKLAEELAEQNLKNEKAMRDYQAERRNPEGLSENAQLTVTLMEAKDLKPLDLAGASDPYVVLTLEEKKLISSYKPGTLDPVWNEEFIFFPITKRNSMLKVEVYDKVKITRDQIHGTVLLDLPTMEHQQKTDKWYDLEVDGNTEGNGSIRLRIHYIFSKYKYFSDNYKKTQDQMGKLDKDIQELNKYFELFEKPFGIILSKEVDSIIKKKILDTSEDVEDYLESNRKSVFVSPRATLQMGMAHKVENIIKGTFKRSNIQWSQLAKLMMYLTLALSCLCLLDRPDFVNLFVGVAIWILFIRDTKIDILDYLKYLLYTIVATSVYDFFWIGLHYSSYWKGNKYIMDELTLKQFTFFFSLLNFLVKIALCISLWIQYAKANHLRTMDMRKSMDSR